MNIDLNLNSEKVNEYISKAILDSVLGENIQKKMTELIDRCLYGYDSELSRVVKETVKEHISQIIKSDKHSTKIIELISRKLTEEKIERLINYGVEEALKHINRAVDEY